MNHDFDQTWARALAGVSAAGRLSPEAIEAMKGMKLAAHIGNVAIIDVPRGVKIPDDGVGVIKAIRVMLNVGDVSFQFDRGGYTLLVEIPKSRPDMKAAKLAMDEVLPIAQKFGGRITKVRVLPGSET